MTADALAVVLTGIGCFEQPVFDLARASGHHESHQAYMVDALVAMAKASCSGTSGSEARDPEDGCGDGSDGDAGEDPEGAAGDAGDGKAAKGRRRRSDPKALMRIRVDLEALLRGHAIAGEMCSIPGLGPVPVALARELLGDAILELVITRGTDVTTVCSDSRYVAKALRIALEERDPVCIVPGCQRSDPLERDHWQVDYAKKGPTRLSNLARICKWHHHLKTDCGWMLEGGPGNWRFTKPDAPPGADPPSEVTDSEEVRPARPKSARGNDPPFQPPLL
jgi:hypothetical protein